MAFRRKAERVLAPKPDLLLVPECECPDRLTLPPSVPQPTHTIWHGENASKGIGVFSYPGLELVD